MQPDVKTFVRVGVEVWLALMGGLLYLGPAFSITPPETPRDLIGSAIALALLITAGAYALWHDLTKEAP